MHERLEGNKIALISNSCPPYGGGGITSAQYNLYLALKAKGFPVKVFTHGDYGIESESEHDIIRHGTPQSIVRAIRFFNNIYFKITDKTKIAYQLSDILVSMFGSLKINKSLQLFSPDILILPDHGCPGFFIKKIKGCRNILISHHNPARFLNEPLLGVYSEKDALCALKIENRALNKIDKVICPSHYMEKVFKETYVYNGPISVIPNLVDDKLINLISIHDIRKEIGLPANSLLIYIPSAGSKHKGSRFVFEIVRRLAASYRDSIGFYLSGNIPEELKRELNFIPVNAKIFMPGHLNLERHIAVVKACSFGISPTLIENFSMAIIEAAFCGIPMVSFETGGNSDIISNGRNGFLVPYLDIEKLIYFSKELFNVQFREDIRLKTAMFVQEKLNSEAILDMYLNCFFSV